MATMALESKQYGSDVGVGRHRFSSVFAPPSSPPSRVSAHHQKHRHPLMPAFETIPEKNALKCSCEYEEDRMTAATSPTAQSADTFSTLSSSQGSGLTEESDTHAFQDHDNAAAVCSEEDGGTVMNVTVTVLSVHGIVVKEIKPKRKKSKGNEKRTDPKAAVVASFVRDTGNKTGLAHVPSRAESVHAMAPAVHWPSMVDVDEIDSDDDSHVTAVSALSTLQFQKIFEREGPIGYAPQACPVDISVSRNGKMVLLGRAGMMLSGEERGETPTVVPIVGAIGKKKNTVTVGKGDPFRFSLGGNASLRVLVKVSNASKKDPSSTKDCTKDNEGLASLQQQLAGYKYAIKALQEELAEAQYKGAVTLHDKWECEAENEQLRAKLELATSNTETLLNELMKRARPAPSEEVCEAWFNGKVMELQRKRQAVVVECLQEVEGWKKREVRSLSACCGGPKE